MSPLVAALVVCSALLHALWSALLKRQGDPEGAAVAILAVAAAVAAGAVPFAGGPAFPLQGGLGWALVAGAFESGCFVTLALALREAPLGVVYPLSRGGALALVWPASVLLLGERFTAAAAAGASVLLVGLTMVGAERRGRASARGVAWAVACAASIAGYHLAYKCSLSTGAAPSAVFATALLVALPVTLARLGLGGPGRALEAWRASPWVVGTAGLLCAASFLVLLEALSQGGAGAVVTLRNTSVLFALLLAWAIGERPRRLQIAGTVAVAAGAVLIGWP
jgi:drug/metabolite transporter (DMT)-like permease